VDGLFVIPDPIWQYGLEESQRFYSFFISGSQRLPNGNTLITDGEHGVFFEVTEDMRTVWKYEQPLLDFSNRTQQDEREVFRSEKYGLDFPAFEGKKLTPLYKLADTQ
jgi:hypothetical protein